MKNWQKLTTYDQKNSKIPLFVRWAIGTTSFAKPTYTSCAAWPLVTRPVASFDRGSLAYASRSRRSKETGVDLAGFLNMADNFW